jgi:hypothetical protein
MVGSLAQVGEGRWSAADLQKLTKIYRVILERYFAR